MNELNSSKVLYKFRDWANEYNQRMLLENEIYFSNNFSFNDIFDLQLPLVFPDIIPFDHDASIKEIEEEVGRKLTRKEINDAETNWYQAIKENPQIIENAKHGMKIQIKAIEDRLGVFCLSKVKTNSLMWGHYANSNRGFCVGLDSKGLEDYIKKEFPKCEGFLEVKYDSEIPIFNGSSNMVEIRQYSKSRSNTKFKDWSYEQEIRVIVDNMANKPHKIPVEIFQEIIFGFKMSIEQREEIRNVCKTNFPEIKFYEAKPSKDKFEMQIIPV